MLYKNKLKNCGLKKKIINGTVIEIFKTPDRFSKCSFGMHLKESDNTIKHHIQTIFDQVDLFLIDHVFDIFK